MLAHAYNPWLVALSFLVATCGSALAFYVADGITRANNSRSKEILMVAGAIAFGLAVWSMHFIGMLALSLCTSVSYDLRGTFLSAWPAIVAAWVVLFWMTRSGMRSWEFLLGGAITGAGIGLMHFMGMKAMRMSALLRFDPLDFAISLAAAVALATFALWARSGLLEKLGLKRYQVNALAVLIMGLAITSMHYLGMMAARFIGEAETALPAPPSDSFYLATLICMGILSALGFVASGVLLTRLRSTMMENEIQRLELGAIIENSTEAIVITNADGEIKDVNKAFESIFGHSADYARGKSMADFLPQWPELTELKPQQFTQETEGRRSGGEAFPARVTYTRLLSDGLAIYVGFISDQTDVKRVQELLQHEANHDFLTGLNNRRYFDEQLFVEIERSRRSGLPLALLMLDIDHFKGINDTYGHPLGDQVLQLLASELRRQARAGDVLSRYGGEEFMLLMPNASKDSAYRMAERLRIAVERLEINYAGESVRFTISIGLTNLSGTDIFDAEDMLKQADKALYDAKHNGRNRVEVFSAAAENQADAKPFGA